MKINVIRILLFALLLVLVYGAKSQEIVKPTDKVLKDTVISNVSYKLYVGSRGGKYVLRTSKTGRVYKMYFKK